MTEAIENVGEHGVSPLHIHAIGVFRKRFGAGPRDHDTIGDQPASRTRNSPGPRIDGVLKYDKLRPRSHIGCE